MTKDEQQINALLETLNKTLKELRETAPKTRAKHKKERLCIKWGRPRLEPLTEAELAAMPETLSPLQASKYLGVNKRTVCQWIYDGKMRSHRVLGRYYEIPRSEVLRVRAEMEIKEQDA